MRQLRWLALLWPGLPQLWFAGTWSAVAIAIGFAALLDLGLLTSRMWTELLSPATQMAIWLVLLSAWAAAAALSWRWVGGLQVAGSQPAGEKLATELFLQARDEYLKGNWFEAETVLGRLLDRNVLDVEARLLKANLLFHTNRRREAIGELDRLTRMEGGEAWRMEIARLRSRLAETRAARVAAERTNGDDNNQGGGVGDAAAGVIRPQIEPPMPAIAKAA